MCFACDSKPILKQPNPRNNLPLLILYMCLRKRIQTRHSSGWLVVRNFRWFVVKLPIFSPHTPGGVEAQLHQGMGFLRRLHPRQDDASLGLPTTTVCQCPTRISVCFAPQILKSQCRWSHGRRKDKHRNIVQCGRNHRTQGLQISSPPSNQPFPGCHALHADLQGTPQVRPAERLGGLGKERPLFRVA